MASQPNTEYAIPDWIPKKSTITHPSLVRATRPREMCGDASPAGPGVRDDARITHGTIANAATPVAMRKAGRQPPNAWASGTTSIPATVTPIVIEVEYSAVTRPIRSGKWVLTRPGSRTLAVAMPERATADSTRNSHGEPTSARAAWPATMSTVDPSTAAVRPTLRARSGASAPNPAKHRLGSAVRTPATVSLMPRSCCS